MECTILRTDSDHSVRLSSSDNKDSDSFPGIISNKSKKQFHSLYSGDDSDEQVKVFDYNSTESRTLSLKPEKCTNNKSESNLCTDDSRVKIVGNSSRSSSGVSLLHSQTHGDDSSHYDSVTGGNEMEMKPIQTRITGKSSYGYQIAFSYNDIVDNLCESQEPVCFANRDSGWNCSLGEDLDGGPKDVLLQWSTMMQPHGSHHASFSTFDQQRYGAAQHHYSEDRRHRYDHDEEPQQIQAWTGNSSDDKNKRIGEHYVSGSSGGQEGWNNTELSGSGFDEMSINVYGKNTVKRKWNAHLCVKLKSNFKHVNLLALNFFLAYISNFENKHHCGTV